MKKIVLFLMLFFVFATCSHAQQNDSITAPNSLFLSPFALVSGHYSKIKIRYQHALKKHFVYGADVKYYFYNYYPGFQCDPFIKYFASRKNTKGLYFYLTAVYGRNKGLPNRLSHYYDCYGGGGGLGWQFIFGRDKRGIIDLSAGIRDVLTNADLSNRDSPKGYDDYFVIGPASIFDGIICIGYRF